MKNITYILYLIFFSQICFGQEYSTITGKVVDEDLTVLPFVQISIGDSILATTNFDGEFKVEINRDIREMNFGMVGFEMTPVVFESTCTRLEIIMLYSGTDCFANPKKTEKLRRKKFDKLKSIYLLAYQKGIFKHDQPCGEIQFVSSLKK